MATVFFWAKPGCVNNTRQKNLLRDAGHVVIERNLLTEPWDVVHLRRFFGTLPVAAWFNGRAPAVKQGLIWPEALSEEQALRLMIADPILIRRPLMQVGARYAAGFDPARVDAWIGLGAHQETSQAMETCPGNLVPVGR
ncbi:MAG: nitrogenase-associated protein [Methylotetracoccus sp.]|jgi:nitrogenase-associated protein|nr:nitrogenase-associated protein [Methylotetracoccus sp.]